MNRLTADNPCGNFDTMMNFSYAKDNRVVLRFGLGQENIDLCDYVAKASKNECTLTPEEVMEGACFECDNGYCNLGIIYTVATQAAELRARLKEYEDQKERHLLKRPIDTGALKEPIKIGNGTFGKGTHILYKCPTCGEWVNRCRKAKYCDQCGQALDWSGD